MALEREAGNSAASGSDSEAQLRVLADSLPQLVWTSSSDGRVDYYNSRVTDYGGWKEDDGAYDWQPLVHPDELDATLTAWRCATTAGDTYEFEHRMLMADGTYRWHLSRALPVRDEAGAIVKWFGTATDVHEHRLAEQDVADLAYVLQRALLPNRLPSVAGVEFGAQYRPASVGQEVGGDWFDAVLSDARLNLVIGDVAGHGVEAAAVMGAARHAIAGSLMSNDGPAESLAATNAYLSSLGELFVTCCVVQIDLRDLTMVAASAGHPAPALNDGNPRLLTVSTGIPLGIDRNTAYTETRSSELGPGRSLTLFTDGLFERRRSTIDAGLQRLLDALEAFHDMEPTEATERLMERLAHDAEDDVAVLMARFVGDDSTEPCGNWKSRG